MENESQITGGDEERVSNVDKAREMAMAEKLDRDRAVAGENIGLSKETIDDYKDRAKSKGEEAGKLYDEEQKEVTAEVDRLITSAMETGKSSLIVHNKEFVDEVVENKIRNIYTELASRIGDNKNFDLQQKRTKLSDGIEYFQLTYHRDQ